MSNSQFKKAVLASMVCLALVISFVADGHSDWCEDSNDGLRACDPLDPPPDDDCPVSVFLGSERYRADYSSVTEAWQYLQDLDSTTNDPYDVMQMVQMNLPDSSYVDENPPVSG